MRFLHTADWHLGMTAGFLSAEARPRYAEDRRRAVREIARIAEEEGAGFVVVSGDVFDSNQIDRAEVSRAVEAMGAFTVPLYILPGNHDPLDAASVYTSRAFTTGKPDLVTVIGDTEPIPVAPGIEIVGAPWTSRRPAGDPAALALAGLTDPRGTTRILIAHGIVDGDAIGTDVQALIAIAPLRRALAEGTVRYVALGDHHSAREVCGEHAIRYAGTPEPTQASEQGAGEVLVVTLDGDHLDVRSRRVGTWQFLRRPFDLRSGEDVEAFDSALADTPGKERTVLRLDLTGSLTVAEDVLLHQVLDVRSDVFAGLTVSDRTYDVAVIADGDGILPLGLSGYAQGAAEEIAGVAMGDGADAGVARDALRLLYRLAPGAGS